MIDFREIQLLDNNFELTDTIAQNEELGKNNRQLLYLGLAISLLLLGTTIYFIKDKYSEKLENKKT